MRIDPGLVNASPLVSQCAFRTATPADVDIVLRHRREMFREMGGKYRESLDQYESASRKYFEAALQDGTYFGLLAELGSEIAGGGGVLIARWPGSPLNFEPKRAWILNLFVEAQYRRQGLAKALTRALIDWCRQNGFASVALHASDYGRGLYEQLGFRSTNEMRLML